MLQIVAALTDNSRGVIYNHNIFIIQATVCLKEYDNKEIIVQFYIRQIFYGLLQFWGLFTVVLQGELLIDLLSFLEVFEAALSW